MTIKKARKILGKKADNLSNKEIQDLISMLTTLVDKAINDSVK